MPIIPPMVDRILILGPSWLGDAVMAIPTFQALRSAYPRAHIAILARSQVADLYQCVPAIDEVIVYRRPAGVSRLFAYIRLIGRLHAQQADLTLILPRSFGAGWTALLANSSRRVGFATPSRRFLLTDPVAQEPALLHGHRVHFLLHLLSPLGLVPAVSAPQLAIPAEAERAADRLLAAHPHGKDGPLVLLNPGANYGTAKQWPEDRYAALGRRLVARHAARIVLVGGPGDRDVCDRIHHEIGANAALDLSGRTSIPELAAVLRRGDVMVSNDTGAMHVGAAVGRRVIAVFGSTDPITTGPYGAGHTVLQEPVDCAPCLLRTCPIDHRCMTRISVDLVFASCERELQACA